MTSKREPFEAKVVGRSRDVKRLVEQGWEVVSTSGAESWFWGSTYRAVLRRPNPRYKG